MTKTVVIVPFYNESKSIEGVLRGIVKLGYKVVAVDDGSKDGGLTEKIKNVTQLRHKVNLGKGAAMKTGVKWATDNGYDFFIFMDADDQHDPEDLKNFYKQISSGRYDIIFGSRNMNFAVPLVRFFGNKLASAVISLLFGIYVSDGLCGFRALTKKAFQKIEWESTGYGVELEMVIRTGKNKLRYKEVPVKTKYLDSVKGVTVLDAFGIFWEVIKWKITI